jgi:hypothetical protein
VRATFVNGRLITEEADTVTLAATRTVDRRAENDHMNLTEVTA